MGFTMAEGLSERERKIIRDKLKPFIQIDKAILFGSRALGNYKKASDVDIALFGANLNNTMVNKISDLLNEETPLPYFFDVLAFSSITNENLKEHILQYGKKI